MTITIPVWLLITISIVYFLSSALNAYAAHLTRELKKLSLHTIAGNIRARDKMVQELERAGDG